MRSKLASSGCDFSGDLYDDFGFDPAFSFCEFRGELSVVLFQRVDRRVETLSCALNPSISSSSQFVQFLTNEAS